MDTNKTTAANNLKPIRSEDEAREKGKKGGIASGKSRKRKAEVKALIEQSLNIKPEYTIKHTDFANLGKDDYLTAIIANLVSKAASGNLQAINTIMKLLD